MMTRRPCFLVLLLLLSIPCEAFTVPMQTAFLCHKSATLSSPSTLYNILNVRKDDNDDYEDRERVRVPRGGGRRYEEDRYEEEYETKERPYYDDDDDDDYYDDDDDKDEEDYDYEETQNDYDGDILIPNPILDQVDPEGAGERFGEIARDPTFWRDLFIVVAVFNFCEYVAQVPYY